MFKSIQRWWKRTVNSFRNIVSDEERRNTPMNRAERRRLLAEERKRAKHARACK